MYLESAAGNTCCSTERDTHASVCALPRIYVGRLHLQVDSLPSVTTVGAYCNRTCMHRHDVHTVNTDVCVCVWYYVCVDRLSPR